MSDYLIERIRDDAKIELLPNTEVTALHGDRMLKAITVRKQQDRRRAQGGNQLAVPLPRRRAANAVGLRSGRALR